MAQQILSSNTFCQSKWVVSPAASDGTHTTIGSALTSASSGDTIFIRPGTYTENLTLKAGVNLTSFTDDGITPNVTIVGNATMSTAGTVSISGIRLQTNSAALLTVSGSVASIVNLDYCYLNCTNNTGITFSSSSASAQINIKNCTGDLGTTGIALFTDSSSGVLTIRQSSFTNTGASTTASTCSVATFNAVLTSFLFPITFSGTGTGTLDYCIMSTSAQNVTAVTLGGASTVWNYCRFEAGTASAISVTGTSNLCICCVVGSSNTNAVTGAGTLKYTPFSFSGTSSTINVTTQTIIPFGPNVPGFLSIKSANSTNQTGNGAAVTIVCDTVSYDTLSNYNSSTGTFTAPIKGKYLFIGRCYITSCTVATTMLIGIASTAHTYDNHLIRAAGAQDFSLQVTAIADMAASDTVTFVVSVSGEAANTNTILGNNSTTGTWFEGRYLGTN